SNAMRTSAWAARRAGCGTACSGAGPGAGSAGATTVCGRSPVPGSVAGNGRTRRASSRGGAGVGVTVMICRVLPSARTSGPSLASSTRYDVPAARPGSTSRAARSLGVAYAVPMRGLIVDYFGVLDGTEEDSDSWRYNLSGALDHDDRTAVICSET